jgi:hypothetical protein
MKNQSRGTVFFVVGAAAILAVLIGGAILSQTELPPGVTAGIGWLAISVAASFIPIFVLYYVIRAAVLAALREHDRGKAWAGPAAGPQPVQPIRPQWAEVKPPEAPARDPTKPPPWPKHMRKGADV